MLFSAIVLLFSCGRGLVAVGYTTRTKLRSASRRRWRFRRSDHQRKRALCAFRKFGGQFAPEQRQQRDHGTVSS
jgi:hypothetical protein